MPWIAEQLLTAIRESDMRDCVTEARLVELTGLTPKQVADACCTLIKNHLLTRTITGCHKLTGAGKEALVSGANLRPGAKCAGLPGKRLYKDTLRIRVWRAIRIRRKFSVEEIIPLVVDGTERGDCTSNVLKYVLALRKAGYLVDMPIRGGQRRFWLPDDKDTGPQAPVWRQHASTVYDPNTEAEVAI